MGASSPELAGDGVEGERGLDVVALAVVLAMLDVILRGLAFLAVLELRLEMRLVVQVVDHRTVPVRMRQLVLPVRGRPETEHAGDRPRLFGFHHPNATTGWGG
jgi:hypothetical protein